MEKLEVFPESGPLVMLSVHFFCKGRLFGSVCGGESISWFCWEMGSSKKYSTLMGPSYIGKSLCQTGNSFFFSKKLIDLLVARLFKTCFSQDCPWKNAVVFISMRKQMNQMNTKHVLLLNVKCSQLVNVAFVQPRFCMPNRWAWHAEWPVTSSACLQHQDP